jgi:hypothetical protein
MEQINERAAVAHSTYVYPREEDCEESAGGEQQWMVDQGSMEVDGEGIAQGHPHMAVPARSAMKRQDREKTGASAGSGRHVTWTTQADHLLANLESVNYTAADQEYPNKKRRRSATYRKKHNCKSLRCKDVH